MRTITLALGAALAGATLAAAPAGAAGAYGDGARLSGVGSLKRFQLGSVATRVTGPAGPAGVATTARPKPESASAPCPGGVGSNGGVFLNGRSPNGWTLNGRLSDGAKLDDADDGAGTGALKVQAVRLADRRPLVVRAR